MNGTPWSMNPCVVPFLCGMCGELVVSNGKWVYCCGDQCDAGIERRLLYDPESDLLSLGDFTQARDMNDIGGNA